MPWEAPNWGPCLSFKPTTGGTSADDRRVAIRMLTEGDDPSIALIHVVDLITNKGRQDGKMVGAAAAVIPCARKDQMNPD